MSRTRRLRVVVAPDKFKGSLEAAEVAAIVASRVRRHSPEADVVEHPIADGGEGTVALALEHGFEAVTAEVTGPLGASVRACYAMRGQVAVIEMASAAGLGLLPGPPTPDTLRRATTYGVGELVLDAVDRGATRVVVGVGGSATTDGGAGAVEALGIDVAQLGRPPVKTGVGRDGLAERLQGVELVVACDVDNPLLGPSGAAQVYGPQKGADSALVDQLEDRLQDWADRVATRTGQDHREASGAGAAGGLAFGLVALAGARLVSGVEFTLQLSGFDWLVADADLVIVGEGSLDAQSLRGKGPVGVARVAAANGCRVVAVVGRNLLTRDSAREAGLSAVYALTELEPDPAACLRDAGPLLALVADRLAEEWLSIDRRPLETGGRPTPTTPAEWRRAVLSTVGVVEDEGS